MKAFAAGAVDYISKPISPAIVAARVRTHLALYDQNRELERKVMQRTQELRYTQMEIIRDLGRAAEFKDNETGLHVVRMSHYSRLIAEGRPHRGPGSVGAAIVDYDQLESRVMRAQIVEHMRQVLRQPLCFVVSRDDDREFRRGGGRGAHVGGVVRRLRWRALAPAALAARRPGCD